MKKILCAVLLAALVLSAFSCAKREDIPHPASSDATTQESDTHESGTQEITTQESGTDAPVTTASYDNDDDLIPVTSDFAPVAGKLYVAYIYVVYVSEDGFAGDGNFNDGVYVACPGAAGTFNIFDTARVVFDGADYTVETRSFDSEYNVTTRQTIKKAINVRRSDHLQEEPVYAKPIIYLYPEKDTVCSVKLDWNGRFTCTYPDYGKDGWRDFTASPDGTLTFPDGGVYYALYWEGVGDARFDMTGGYCVKGADTAEFLADILPRLGLNPKETNEFIIYWLPRMQNNPYNLITFPTERYENEVKLEITPEPDSVIRVFMAYKALDQAVKTEPGETVTPQRNGFTVVEWGGCEVK